MGKEVGELELQDGLPKGKLQEPLYGVRMSESESNPQDGCPGFPYIEFRARACTKRGFSRPKGREPKGGPSSLGLQATPSSGARPVVAIVMIF